MKKIKNITNPHFQELLKSEKVFTTSEIADFCSLVRKSEYRILRKARQGEFLEIPAAFDIETSSFMQDGQKRACMYEWTFGMMGAVIYGRTWDEFMELCVSLMSEFGLGEHRHLIVYVHNLAYEFQWIRKMFTWSKVFATKTRVPVQASCDAGIEFRCSYILSGYSLAKLGEHLQRYKVEKLVGNLDYEKIRHSGTPLTDAELAYCVNDVKVVMAYIQEEIESCGKITSIPLTKTGYVRKFVRNACFFEKERKGHRKSFKRWRYTDMMKHMTLDPDEYQQLKRAFQGGFTHANAFFNGKVTENVTSYDFTSSYPATMISRQFPMSKSERVEIKSVGQFEKNLQLYCCLFDIEFDDIESIIMQENYISISRCFHTFEPVVNNGRVVRAKKLAMTLTEQDFFIIRRCYRWSHMRIANFRRYKRGYLPTDFVKAILKLYQDKTQLKGVAGSEVEYLRSKEMLNSCYGMCVTDIVREEIEYTDDGEWKEKLPILEKAIEEYNDNRGRFLFYPWGVWTTAYARANLYTAILAIGDDYIYSDTDSVKVQNVENHAEYFAEYNQFINEDLDRAMKFHGIEKDAVRPKTIKGEKKVLGEWDLDGKYLRFLTLGAKRYMMESEDGYSITVSGLNKKVAMPYILKASGGHPFDFFTDSMYIPAGKTGKMTHTYIDVETFGRVTDYLGNEGTYHEQSSVHLEPADYSLSIAREYKDYLFSLE